MYDFLENIGEGTSNFIFAVAIFSMIAVFPVIILLDSYNLKIQNLEKQIVQFEKKLNLLEKNLNKEQEVK